MPRPDTPYSVDNVSMGTEERNALNGIVDIIYGANPTRSKEGNLQQALDVFRLMYKRGTRRWVKKPFFRIGREGDGPVVFPSSSP